MPHDFNDFGFSYCKTDLQKIHFLTNVLRKSIRNSSRTHNSSFRLTKSESMQSQTLTGVVCNSARFTEKMQRFSIWSTDENWILLFSLLVWIHELSIMKVLQRAARLSRFCLREFRAAGLSTTAWDVSRMSKDTRLASCLRMPLDKSLWNALESDNSSKRCTYVKNKLN